MADKGSVFAIVSCKHDNCGEEKQKEEFEYRAALQAQ